MDEEKLNINIRLYHIYKKLINSKLFFTHDIAGGVVFDLTGPNIGV